MGDRIIHLTELKALKRICILQLFIKILNRNKIRLIDSAESNANEKGHDFRRETIRNDPKNHSK